MANKKATSFFIQTTTNGVVVNLTGKSANSLDFEPSSLPINVEYNKNKVHIQISGFEQFNNFYKQFAADILLMHTTEKIWTLFFMHLNS